MKAARDGLSRSPWWWKEEFLLKLMKKEKVWKYVIIYILYVYYSNIIIDLQ